MIDRSDSPNAKGDLEGRGSCTTDAKNTVIGLTAIFTFVLVELAAIFCTVGASVPVRRGCAPAVVERGLRLKLGRGTVTSCKYRGPFTYIPRNFRLCENC